MKLRDRKIQDSGFTMIELLVVMGIISLLISLALPVLSGARRSAQRAACRSNLRACGVGLKMYLEDYRNVMPRAAYMPGIDPQNRPGINTFILPYVSGEKSLLCPGDPLNKFFEANGASYGYFQRIGGENVDKTMLSLGFRDYQMHILWDYDPFHGKRNTVGAFNYLYADGHVGNREDG